VADFEGLCNGWRGSTASGGENCVEVAATSGSVLVRDSANRDGPVLRFSPTAWSAFVTHSHANDPDPGRA
jgi:hypothetical protein